MTNNHGGGVTATAHHASADVDVIGKIRPSRTALYNPYNRIREILTCNSGYCGATWPHLAQGAPKRKRARVARPERAR